MCNDETVSILFRDPLLDAAREAAVIATHRMTAWAGALTPVSVGSKDGKNDLVTAADAEIEALVRHRFASLRPADTVVGEEGAEARSLTAHPDGEEIRTILARAAEAARTADRPDAGGPADAGADAGGPAEAGPDEPRPDEPGADRAEPADGRGAVEWHIDPIDGTVNFVRGIEHFCFSAGARLQTADPSSADDGWVAGLVAAPMLDRVWFARAGTAWVAPLAALTNPGVPVRELTGSSAPTTGRVVATGFGYAAKRRAQQLAALGDVMAQFDDVRRCGSAAVDLCMAAEGRVNAYYERGLGVYDFAGGAYIAECAGRFVRRRADSFLRDGAGASIGLPEAESGSTASTVPGAGPGDAEAPTGGPVNGGGADGEELVREPAAELTVVADTRERFEFLLAHG